MAKQAGTQPASVYWSVSLLGLLLYNNWILAIVLNFKAFIVGATSSELGVAGQPFYQVFRWLDIVSGLCFILTFALIGRIIRQPLLAILARLIILLLGVSTVVESLVFPLKCASALSVACAQQENSYAFSPAHRFHELESVVSYILTFLLPVLVAWSVQQLVALRRLYLVSMALLVFMLVWALESAYRESHQAATFGYEQRIFMILFSYWYYLIIKTAKSLKLNHQ